jgi:hypothetical protein
LVGKTSNALKQFQVLEGQTSTGKIDSISIELLSKKCAIIQKINFESKLVANEFFE